MSKQVTLQDIYSVVNRLEDKMDSRLRLVEDKVNTLEGLANRALVIFGIISTIGSAAFSYIWQKVVGKT